MKKLEFGTAGIRGILGDDESNLNEVHVIRVIEGFARYLISNFPDAKKQGVVIGRDNRRESQRFAEISSMILSKYEIKVYYNQDISPTPFISFVTRTLRAIGAINITASHNPKEYNGIKLYDKEGCQLLPNEVSKLLTFFKPYDKYKNVKFIFEKNEYINFVSQELMDKYLNQVKKIGGSFQNFSNIKVAYTPQHGTGAKPIKSLFSQLKINSFYEEKEMIEDTEFTYSKNPNPEVKESFDNVLITARNNDCDIALVTDPDADRVGAAIKHNDEYQIITGNETAILIFNYLINQVEKNKLNQYYLIYSFVSSSLPKKIAEENGIKYYMTETGFKWIGNVIENLSKINPKEKFLFAFEESYGSLIDEDICRDKDAIQSIVILSKMTSYYKKQGLDLIQVLNKIYEKYGFVSSGTIVLNIKSEDHLENIKSSFVNLKIKNAKFLDYNDGIRSIEPNNMLTYEFDNQSWISLRPSGTEPKIKIYLFFIDKFKDKAKQNYDKYFELLSNL